MTDPRMQGFRHRAEVSEVLELLKARTNALPPEEIASVAAWGRVLSESVVSPSNVPSFDRSAMDGYAVRGSATFGASSYSPICLGILGVALPGQPYPGPVGEGEAVRIMTGAPIPAGADAVVKAEVTRREPPENGADRVLVLAAVPPGKNISRKGEDLRAGDVLAESGRALRPQDIGVLVSAQVPRVRVHRRPRVDLVATGNELVRAGETPQRYQIADSNTPMLLALVERDGGAVTGSSLVGDDPKKIREALKKSTSDVVLVIGGSSVGEEDHVPSIVSELGELPIHGVAMRPSSPTGVGFFESRPVFLLPGNPVSCLCAYDFFGGPTIRALGGRAWEWPYATVRLPLSRKLTSEVGRVDYARVRVVGDRVEPLMVSGASILSSTTKADGVVIVGPNDEGIPAGKAVTVYLYGG